MSKEIKDYRVTWEIDISARNPLEAARLARESQTRENTAAVVFDCSDDEGNQHRVDLLEDSVVKI